MVWNVIYFKIQISIAEKLVPTNVSNDKSMLCDVRMKSQIENHLWWILSNLTDQMKLKDGGRKKVVGRFIPTQH